MSHPETYGKGFMGAGIGEFSELARDCSEFTLRSLDETRDRALAAMDDAPTRGNVRALRMIELQRAVFVVGLFSMFEASLGEELESTQAFKKTGKLLAASGCDDLRARLHQFDLAINVLKHGRGKSYEALLKVQSELPFKIRDVENSFFFEGDVAEVSMLVRVDDRFVRQCVGMITEIASFVAIMATKGLVEQGAQT